MYLGEIKQDRLVEEVKRAYNHNATRYTKYAGNRDDIKIDINNPWAVSDLITLKILTEMIKRLNYKNNNKLKGLDAGCGDGVWSLRIAKMYKNVEMFGVDIAEKMIEIANERARKVGLSNRCNFKVGDIQNLSFIPDNSIDFIICLYDPLNHVPCPKYALAEFYRILKPGGLALATVHSRSDFTLYVASEDEVTDYIVASVEGEGELILFRTNDSNTVFNLFSRRYTFEELKSEFESVGFTILQGYGIDIMAKRELKIFMEKENLNIKELRKIISKLYLRELKLYKDYKFVNKAIHIGILACKNLNNKINLI